MAYSESHPHCHINNSTSRDWDVESASPTNGSRTRSSLPLVEPDLPDVNAERSNVRSSHNTSQQAAESISPGAAQEQSLDDATSLEEDEKAGLLSQSSDAEQERRCRPSWCLMVTICITVLVAAVTALAVLLWQDLHSSQRSNHGTTTDLEFSDTHNDSLQDFTVPPVKEPYFPKSQCAYQHYSEPEYVDFPSLHEFGLYESMGFLEPVPLSGEIEGTLHIQPSSQLGQGVDIRLGIAYAATPTVRVAKSNYMKHNNVIAFELPDLENTQQDPEEVSCLGVFIGLEIRSGLEMKNITLGTMNLDMVVADGLFDTIQGTEEKPHLLIKGESNLSPMAGKGIFSYWASGSTIVKAEGSIQGRFALNDLLSLENSGGFINASVDPRPGNVARPVPAEFNAISNSGSIDVQFPVGGERLPSRDYRTRIGTISSQIRGSYVAGTSFSATTTSGDIHAKLLPYHRDNQPLTIHTKSETGKTTLKVLPPDPEDSWPLKSIQHRSTSTNGSISIIYPHQWEGAIEARTLRGSFSIERKDVKIIDESHGPGMKHITAQKGSGSGRLRLETTGGNVSVRVEDN